MLGVSLSYNRLAMISSKQIYSRNIKTTRIKLANGWKGRVALEIAGRNFSKNDWVHSLSEPQLLFENTEKILKAQGRNCVVVKNLTIAEKPFKVVVKRDFPATNFRQFFRSFQPVKALRNFKTALKLLSCGIPVVFPFAALYRRCNLFTKQGIYITKYAERSFNMHDFASNQLSKISAENFAVKKQLCRQLAIILASLHNNNLWHRDSKATNLIICQDTAGKYKILLADLDGIKRHFLRRKSRQLRSLWRLAASLMPIAGINRTDYLRTFKIYCDLVDLETAQRKENFLKLAICAKAKYLRSKLKTIADE